MKWSHRWPWSGLLLAAVGFLGWSLGDGCVDAPVGPGVGTSVAHAQGIARPAAEGDVGVDEETGIFLPSDRLRERQLDQARQAIAAGSFSDASTVLDDILSGDADSFVRSADGGATRSSVKAEAAGLLDAMPAAGRDAYELQFRARSERMLAQALATDDREQVVAVARRWFHTPAGQAAAVVTALDCLANGQPLSAVAWLDRLARRGDADRFEPAISLMRAVASYEAGDRKAAEVALADATQKGDAASLTMAGTVLDAGAADGQRIAFLDRFFDGHNGGDGTAGGPLGSGREQGSDTRPWLMAGGTPSRSHRSTASRPLLTARFRVPLTRHPGESRLLTRQRLMARDRERPLLPAGQPLVVGDTIVLRSPLGLLGVDFTTGKRIWLEAGRFDDDAGLAGLAEAGDRDGGEQPVARGYEDLTTGLLASDGRLLFAVESPAAASASLAQTRIVRPFGMAGGNFSGNVLSAYDPADKASLVWRLPAAVDDASGDDEQGRGFRPDVQRAAIRSPWYLGPPLPVGNELYVLVEELGEIRLDVLEAATGSLLWSQPLAELDEDRRIEQPGSRLRRLAGLSPSLDDGVLVCPTGAGGVVGIDVATRTLLWAYRYESRPQEDIVRLPNGMIIRRGGRGLAEVADDDQQRWVDALPVMADGRVFLTPAESDELHCLETRSGKLCWKVARGDGLMVAGIDGPRVIVVGSEGVTALDVVDGSLAWPDRFAFDSVRQGTMPSGRGVLCDGRLLLPLDTPAVLELDLTDGSRASLSVGDEAIPGNLVAYRGQILSQSIDSLDVFYQTGPLSEALAAAQEEGADGVGALVGGLAGYWKGQLLIDSGQPRAGAEAVAAAGRADPERVSPRMVSATMLQALRLDFPEMQSLFPMALESCLDPDVAGDMLRLGIDGSLALRKPREAWQLWQQAAAECLAGGMLPDRDDPEGGPVADGTDPLLTSLPSRWLGGRLEAVLAYGDESIAEEVGEFIDAHVAQARADGPRQMGMLVDLVAAAPAAESVRQQFVEMLANPLPGQEPVSVGNQRDRQLRLELMAMLTADAAAEPVRRAVNDPAWPVGRVAVASTNQQGRRAEAPPLASLPIEGPAGFPFPEGLRLTLDRRQPGMLIRDGFGRQLGEMLSYEGSAQTRRLGIQSVVLPGASLQPTIVGRLLVVASSSGTAAFEVSLPTADEENLAAVQHRRLWHSGDGGGGSNPMLAGRGTVAPPYLGGSIPLGTVVSEPRGVGRETPPTLRGPAMVPNGAAVLQNHTLSMRDPVSGRVLWARSMLPSASSVLIDAVCVCVCPADGGAAGVYSMHDGRQIRQTELPPVSEWLTTCGRRVLAIERSRVGNFTRGTVALVLIDPLTGETVRFGPFAAATRAAPAGSGKVCLLDPDGRLRVVDLLAGGEDFAVTLERMPHGFNQVSVMPWRDRLMVIAGRPETSAESEQHRQLGAISGVRTAGLWDAGQQLAPLVTGAVWAVDRDSGETLWSVPATVLRHGFDAEQPADLPVLVFARRIKSPGSTRQPRLSLLCLDKRTGSEVFADDRIETDQHLFYGCEVQAEPSDHTVTLTHGARDITLTFTGDAVSPRPPYQGLSRPLSPPSLSDKIEAWFEQALESFPF